MNKESKHEIEQIEEIPSFNDATDHYQRIMGVPNKRVDYRNLPKILRIFSYFVAIVLFLCTIGFIIGIIFR